MELGSEWRKELQKHREEFKVGVDFIWAPEDGVKPLGSYVLHTEKVEEYTGFKDRTGTSIRCGDIVRGRSTTALVAWQSPQKKWVVIFKGRAVLLQRVAHLVEVVDSLSN